MKNAFEDIDGDFAITWIKESNRKIHLARESGRPMYVAYWKKARVLLWASTKDILETSMIQAGLRLPVSKVQEDYIFTYDTDKFSSKPSVEQQEFYTMSQWNRYDTTKYYGTYGAYGWQDSTDFETCDMNPSPASKSLLKQSNELMCGICYEWVDSDEIEIVNRENMCIDCEYQVDMSTLPSNDKEISNEDFPF